MKRPLDVLLTVCAAACSKEEGLKVPDSELPAVVINEVNTELKYIELYNPSEKPCNFRALHCARTTRDLCKTPMARANTASPRGLCCEQAATLCWAARGSRSRPMPSASARARRASRGRFRGDRAEPACPRYERRSCSAIEAPDQRLTICSSVRSSAPSA